MTTEELTGLIASTVRTNGTGAITGAALQAVLLDMVGGGRVTDLGVSGSQSEMEYAVKAEALRVPEGATGGLPENVTIYAAYSAGGALRKYTFRTQTTETGTYLLRCTPGTTGWSMALHTSAGWSDWQPYGGSPLLCYAGDVADVDDFARVMGQQATINNGAVLYFATTSAGNVVMCVQLIDRATTKARQWFYAQDGVTVRDVTGIESESPTAFSRERAMPQKFWLNGQTLAIGDYGASGSGAGNVANVSLSGLGGGADGLEVASRRQTAITLSLKAGELVLASVELPMATEDYAGLLNAADKEKLNGLADIEEYGKVSNGGYESWGALRTAMGASAPTARVSIVAVDGETVLLFKVEKPSILPATVKYYAFDGSGVLRTITATYTSSTQSTWGMWQETDLTDTGDNTESVAVAPYTTSDSPRLSVNVWHAAWDAAAWSTVTAARSVQYCTELMTSDGKQVATGPMMVLYGTDANGQSHGFGVWPSGALSGYPSSAAYYAVDGDLASGLNRSVIFRESKGGKYYINVTTGALTAF